MGGLPQRAHLAVKSGYHWRFFYKIVDALGIERSSAFSLKAKLTAGARIKSNMIGAVTLADLLYLDYLPIAPIVPRDMTGLWEILMNTLAAA